MLQAKLKFSWDSQQGRDKKTSILVLAFQNFKLQLLKHKWNFRIHATVIWNLVKSLNCICSDWYEIPCNMCFFMFPLWAKVRSQLSHLKGLLPSWTVSICFSMNFFSVKLFPQTLHMWGLFPSWTDSTCLLRSAFSLRCEIFFFPLVSSKQEENILVFLS